MRRIEWIVLDDLKMNLIAALIVLVLAASFVKGIELPFSLTRLEKQIETVAGRVRSVKILVFRQGRSLKLKIGADSTDIHESDKLIDSINPSLPVIVAVQENSGMTYDQLLKILTALKARGVSNVSLVAQQH